MEKSNRGPVKRPSFKKPQSRPAVSHDQLVYGIHSVEEALVAGANLEKLFLQKESNHAALKIIQQKAQQAGIPTQWVPGVKLDQLTRKNHQGVVGLLALVEYVQLENLIQQVFEQGRDPFVLICDHITDVRNFGAIARTASCTGIDALVVPASGNAPINGDALKTSAGALAHMPVCREQNLKLTIEMLKQYGLRIVGCTEKTKQNFFELDLSGPLALILGSEETGISPDLLKRCDSTGALPMTGQISSLNVSVAAGVAMYAVFQQKLMTG
jgi:23S rRNA (guanosine2251-2'-O)-methyltransferase